MLFKSLLGFTLAAYSLILLGAAIGLSHYQWPQTTQAELIDATDGLTVKPRSKAPLQMPPPDFANLTDVNQRKQAFFDYFLPLIREENDRLMSARAQLQAIRQKVASNRPLSARERLQLELWAEQFRVDADTQEALLDTLDRRINAIPEALVLAQAASESAWGTSRFAIEGHNYFGQWCFRQGCGMVPLRRPANAIHEVARFASPQESLQAYFHNLNTYFAYREFRDLRRKKTEANQPLLAADLADALQQYSERGEEYIEELRAIIRSNSLEPPTVLEASENHTPKG